LEATNHKNSNHYVNAVHLLSQDTVVAEDVVPDGMHFDLQQLFAKAWTEWSSVDVEASSLPLVALDSYNKAELVSLMCRAILNGVMLLDPSSPSSSSPSPPLSHEVLTTELARWALVMKCAHLKPPSSFLDTDRTSSGGCGSLGEKTIARLLSSIDSTIGDCESGVGVGGAPSIGQLRCDFQLSLRLTIIAILCAITDPALSAFLTELDHARDEQQAPAAAIVNSKSAKEVGSKRKALAPTRPASQEKKSPSLREALSQVLCVLTNVDPQVMPNATSPGRESFGAVLFDTLRQRRTFSGVVDGTFWWSQGGTHRAEMLSVCLLSLDVIGAVVSHFDRRTYQPIETNPFLWSAPQLLAQHCLFLSTSASSSSSSSVPFSINACASSTEHFFEYADAGRTGNGGRTSALFDNNQNAWRLAKKHANEAVVNNIKTNSRGLLTGLEISFKF